jgi:hypothetical protein
MSKRAAKAFRARSGILGLSSRANREETAKSRKG